MRIKHLLLVMLVLLLTQTSAQSLFANDRADELLSQLKQLKQQDRRIHDRELRELLQKTDWRELSASVMTEVMHWLRGELSETELLHRLQHFETQLYLYNRLFDLKKNASFAKTNGLHRVPEKKNALTPVLDDFQVNENVGNMGWSQRSSVIAMDGAGNFVVVWTDIRSGDSDIYGQRYDYNGNPLGKNFIISDDKVSWSQEKPAIAMDSSGNFMVVWWDCRKREGGGSGGYWIILYGQWYNSDGTARGDNFTIAGSDRSGSNYYEEYASPTIAVNSSGNFIVVCNGGSIYARCYNRSGTALGSSFKINNAAINNDIPPEIAVNDNGNFVVVWVNEVNQKTNIYGQCINSSGTLQEGNFKISDCAADIPYFALTAKSNGNFVVVWKSELDGKNDIYGQCFDSSGVLQEDNFKINNNAADIAYYTYPAAPRSSNDNFMVVWPDRRNGNSDIYGQRFSSSNTAQGTNFKINDDATDIDDKSPSISMDGNGNFMVVWIRGDRDLYGQRFSSNGTALGGNFKINDKIDAVKVESPTITMDRNSNYFVMWTNYGEEYSDIYGQHFDSSGTTQNDNYQINEKETGCWQFDPVIAVDGSSHFVVVWTDLRGGSHLSGQLYNSAGIAQGNNFKVSNSPYYGLPGNVEVTMDSIGNFMVVWKSYSGIYGQRFNNSGTALGGNFIINEDAGWWYDPTLLITNDGNGGFIKIWYEELDRKNRILSRFYGQRLDSSGVAQGNKFVISHSHAFNPLIAMDGNGNFVVVWLNNPDGMASIHGRRFNSNCIARGSHFTINRFSCPYYPKYPTLDVDNNGNFVVLWVENRYGDFDFPYETIYGQFYDSNGLAVGDDYRVDNDPAWKQKNTPDVKLMNGHIYSVWQDYRCVSHGADIFARIDRFNSPPKAPTLLAPGNNDFINHNAPVLSFTNPFDPENDSLHFKIEIATDRRFTRQITGSPFKSQTNSAGFSPTPPVTAHGFKCSYSLQSALNDGTYYWRVAARDLYKFGVTSGVFKFTIDTKPPCALNHNPAKNDTNVAVDTNITMHLRDNGSGVKRSGIVLKVDGRVVTPVITLLTPEIPSASNYLITYDPPVDFKCNQTVSVTLDAADNANNKISSETYIFSTKTGPVQVDAFEAEEMQNRNSRFGSPCADGWRLTHRDQPIHRDVLFPADTLYFFTITAKAEIAGNAAPWLKVETGAGFTGCCEVNSSEWQEYSFIARVPADSQRFKLTFLNDGWTKNAGDRNLLLDQVSIFYYFNQTADSTFTFEAENMSHQHQKNARDGDWMVLQKPFAYVAHDMFFSKNQDLTFEIYAKADSMAEGWPQLDLEVNGKTVGTVAVTKTDPAVYQFKIADISAGECRVKIAYHSDSWAFGRRLYLDKLVIIAPEGGLLKPVNDPFSNEESTVNIPETYALNQNYPNPFNPETRISYHLPQDSQVVLKIYNLFGQEIQMPVNLFQPAGQYSTVWNGKLATGETAPSGIYWCKFQAGEYVQVRKMILTR